MRFAEWVKDVREKCKMNQTQFGEKIVYFKWKSKEEICANYHRNSVANWEKGKNLPTDIETFVSIALLEYSTDNSAIINSYTIQERNAQFQHVQNRLEKYYGRKLYCRNLNDILLVQAARGIFPLDEIPQLRKGLNSLIDSVELSQSQIEKYALDEKTTYMESEFMMTKNKDEFEMTVKKYETYFRIGARTLGERLKNTYKNSYERLYGLNLDQAVKIYAPANRYSYKRIFEKSFAVSRQWLICLCVHLHFKREHINEVLCNAKMMELSEKKENFESLIRETKTNQVGTVGWYKEKNMIRYVEAKTLSVENKFIFCMLLTVYVELQEIEDIPPIDYLLEFFLQTVEGSRILEDCRKKCQEMLKQDRYETENIINIMKSYFGDMNNVLDGNSNVREKAYQTYCDEFRVYDTFPEMKIKNPCEHTRKIRLIIALTYSIFTGKIYSDYLSEKDLEELRNELSGTSEEFKYVYRFLITFWIMFLDKNTPIQERENDKIFMIKNDKSITKKLKNFWEDIVESWSMYENI